MELPVLTRLKKELADLKYELTVKLPKELETARAHGDLSENAEWEAAKARQDFVRSRIGQLEGRVRELSMYNVSSIPHDVVAYGSRSPSRTTKPASRSRTRSCSPKRSTRRRGRSPSPRRSAARC